MSQHSHILRISQNNSQKICSRVPGKHIPPFKCLSRTQDAGRYFWPNACYTIASGLQGFHALRSCDSEVARFCKWRAYALSWSRFPRFINFSFTDRMERQLSLNCRCPLLYVHSLFDYFSLHRSSMLLASAPRHIKRSRSEPASHNTLRRGAPFVESKGEYSVSYQTLSAFKV